MPIPTHVGGVQLKSFAEVSLWLCLWLQFTPVFSRSELDGVLFHMAKHPFHPYFSHFVFVNNHWAYYRESSGINWCCLMTTRTFLFQYTFSCFHLIFSLNTKLRPECAKAPPQLIDSQPFTCAPLKQTYGTFYALTCTQHGTSM